MDDAPGTGAQGGDRRTAPELATLLLELARVVKARRYYKAGDPRLADIFSRFVRTWLGDLGRKGTLILEVGPQGFREAGQRGVLTDPHLAELRRELGERGVHELRFEPEVDAEALAGLAEVLASDAGRIAATGGFAVMLEERVPFGITVAGPVPAVAVGLPSEDSDADLPPIVRIPDPVPAVAAPLAPAAASDDEAPTLVPALAEDEPVLEIDPPESTEPLTIIEEDDPAIEALPPDDPTAETVPAEVATATDLVAPERPAPVDVVPAVPDIEPPPPETPANPAATDELTVRLRELGLCTSVADYTDLARRICTMAERAFDQGDTDAFVRAVRAFARHVDGKEESRLAETAASFLSHLAVGPRLDHLIERAAEGSEDGVHASRALLLLDDDAIRHLVDRAITATDRIQRERLLAVVLAASERALPALLDQLGDDRPDVVRHAIRLIGDTQHPAAVPRLADGLHHRDAETREETARALVRIGSDEAIAILARASRHEDAGIVALALNSLASTGNVRALPPIENALERAIEAKDVARAKEIIKALGRMQVPEAARPLAALLQRRSRLQRWLRDLKVAAIAALGGIPGDEAVGALAQAAHYRDAQMRKTAQTALDRRAGALTRRS